MKTASAIEAFIASCRARSLSPRTIEFYLWATAYLPAELPRDIFVIENILGTYKHSAESRKSLFRGLKVFFNWTSQRYKIRNPISGLRSPRAPRNTNARGLQTITLQRLLHLDLSRRDRALIMLLIDTGIRIAEAHGLQHQDINAETIIVHGKTGYREVPVSSDVRKSLIGVQLPWTGLRGILTVRGLGQIVKRSLITSGVGYDRSHGPHALRHTFGRQWILAGGDAISLQRIMGHASISTTRIYVDLDTRDTIQQHKQFSPLKAALQ